MMSKERKRRRGLHVVNSTRTARRSERRLGAGVTVEATAPDGVIEAICDRRGARLHRRQWHPEWQGRHRPQSGDHSGPTARPSMTIEIAPGLTIADLLPWARDPPGGGVG